jgi:hypothetical protein
MRHAVIVILSCVAVASPGTPQDHSSTAKTESNTSPQRPVTFVDNSSHRAQAERPPEKPNKAEAPIEWANWALVAVGLLTFYAVWKQAKETTRATQAMRDSIPLQKKSADAALANAQAVINAERAWVDITLHRMGMTTYEFRVTNVGKSPAFLTAQSLGRGYWPKDVEEIPIGHPGQHIEKRVL